MARKPRKQIPPSQRKKVGINPWNITATPGARNLFTSDEIAGLVIDTANARRPTATVTIRTFNNIVCILNWADLSAFVGTPDEVPPWVKDRNCKKIPPMEEWG